MITYSMQVTCFELYTPSFLGIAFLRSQTSAPDACAIVRTLQISTFADTGENPGSFNERNLGFHLTGSSPGTDAVGLELWPKKSTGLSFRQPPAQTLPTNTSPENKTFAAMCSTC